MELEQAVLEAIKSKLKDVFDEILVTVAMEGKDIVIRIGLPEDMMNKKESDKDVTDRTNLQFMPKSNLDTQAQSAATELLGIQPQPDFLPQDNQ